MSSRVEVDGVRFVKADDSGRIKIVVLDRGYVYVGHCEDTDDGLEIHQARCIIRWGTDKHLGQLVNGPQENTRLGDPCLVKVRWDKIIHLIEVDQDAWTN